MRMLQKNQECCGCGVCAIMCPKSAIKMIPDDLGFLYPIIDHSICINCGLCERICHFKQADRYKSKAEPSFWAVRNKDIDELSKSRSGSAFSAFSDYILEHDGVVYGAAFNDDFKVIHKRAVTKDERDLMRGSKYVQSDSSIILKDIIADLKKGHTVLYSGTGCQVAGVKSCVPNSYQERLFTVDIVCHGVPSPKLFNDYIEYCKKKYGKEISKFEFRDKTRVGWSGHEESLTFSTGGKHYDNIYTKIFYSNAFFRDSCYNCPYASIFRTSDITLADYWGWEKIDSSFNSDNKGCSLVLVNTIKGESLFEKVSDSLSTIKTTKELSLQRNLKEPTPMPIIRDVYIKYFLNHSFDCFVKRYINVTLLNRFRNLINKIQICVRKK